MHAPLVWLIVGFLILNRRQIDGSLDGAKVRDATMSNPPLVLIYYRVPLTLARYGPSTAMSAELISSLANQTPIASVSWTSEEVSILLPSKEM